MRKLLAIGLRLCYSRAAWPHRPRRRRVNPSDRGYRDPPGREIDVARLKPRSRHRRHVVCMCSSTRSSGSTCDFDPSGHRSSPLPPRAVSRNRVALSCSSKAPDRPSTNCRSGLCSSVGKRAGISSAGEGSTLRSSFARHDRPRPSLRPMCWSRPLKATARRTRPTPWCAEASATSEREPDHRVPVWSSSPTPETGPCRMDAERHESADRTGRASRILQLDTSTNGRCLPSNGAGIRQSPRRPSQRQMIRSEPHAIIAERNGRVDSRVSQLSSTVPARPSQAACADVDGIADVALPTAANPGHERRRLPA